MTPMNLNIMISLIITIILALLCGWLAVRAWRAQRKLVKWPGVVVAGVLALLLALAAGLAAVGLYRLNMPDSSPAPTVQVAGSPEQLAQGERLANLCASCHSSAGQLPLAGGAESIIDGIGTLYAPNLTPGGPLRDWTDGEIIRAIRQGIRKDGRALLIMPSDQYHRMGDEDVRSLVAYLRTQPAVDRQTPETRMNLFGALLIGANVFPISAQPPLTTPVEAPAASPTAEYGQYLVTISGCGACHGEDLQGGDNEFIPIGPNLPAIVSQWTAEEFIETMRTGVDPLGHTIDPETMPWPNFSAAFTDEELEAIYEYILDLSPARASSR